MPIAETHSIWSSLKRNADFFTPVVQQYLGSAKCPVVVVGIEIQSITVPPGRVDNSALLVAAEFGAWP